MPSKNAIQKDHYLKQELYELIHKDNSLFDALQDSSLDGLWYWDLENPENAWMSDKGWTALGYNPEEMGNSLVATQEMINPSDLKIATQNLEKHLKNPDHPYDQIVRYRHKDGHMVYMRCRGKAIRDKDGRPTRLIGSHVDITEGVELGMQKDINADLLQLNKELESKNKELQQFTYITSHDLQEPLNSILSFSRLLETNRDRLNEIGEKSLDVIVYSANRMKDFITALLFYSRIGKEKERKRVEMSKVLLNLKIDLHEMIQKDKAQINYIGKVTELDVFENDFHQLILNLTTNAFKYVADDVTPFLVIDAKEDDEKITFSFADNGIGIEEQHFDRIFEVFQRLHAEDKYHGTGIGLAHCKRVVELHGGDIWLTSTPGKGTTFYFTIKK
ncbi:MAG: hypothetical protein CMB99_11650 [Flavobacteriaceae bacterium]|nr:hypothetical protein [Flavobacteriaceae bacterium]|tara:strand:- start:227662 stop:228828 length:1167 start_codon:yes stop_codon:yes gene_type:complete